MNLLGKDTNFPRKWSENRLWGSWGWIPRLADVHTTAYGVEPWGGHQGSFSPFTFLVFYFLVGWTHAHRMTWVYSIYNIIIYTIKNSDPLSLLTYGGTN